MDEMRLRHSRRRFLLRVAGLLPAVSFLGRGRLVLAQVPRRPDPATFQSGDILWPKPPGKIVPYEATPGPNEPEKWADEKDTYVREKLQNGTPEEKDAAAKLITMQFTEFQEQYLADQPPGLVTPHGANAPGPLYIGHVAIVRMDNGVPFVVEAVSPSVRYLAYSAWLADRGQDDVWLGRISDRTTAERARMADEAKKYVGIPYQFFNFDLNDASGTYCSKLAWLATFRSLNVALDDDPQPFRFPWYSPKRLMRSPHVCLLFDPGGYTDSVPLCP